MRLSRGVVLALAGLVVLSTTLAASAATAPSRNVSAGLAATPTVDATTAQSGDADTVGSATADGTLRHS